MVAGGGKIACHKVKILLGFGVKLFVVAPSFDADFKNLKYEEGQICFQKRRFLDSDIEEMDFAVAATGNEELDFHISKLCQEKGVLVNVVDRKEWCTFIFPALLQEEDLLVAVSSGGKSPAAAAFLKEKLRKAIPAYYGGLVKKLGEYRDYITERVGTAKERKRVFYQLLDYGDSHEGELPESEVRRIVMESVKEMKISQGMKRPCQGKSKSFLKRTQNQRSSLIDLCKPNKVWLCEAGMSESAEIQKCDMVKEIRIGTRGSELALVQANQVAAALHERFPDILTETVVLRTKGDKILDKPLFAFGGKGVFVEEIEKALTEGSIDIAVHSAKDMPMELGDSLVIAGVLKRADARDVLVVQKESEIAEWLYQQKDLAAEEKKYMKKSFVIGTGSLRRQFQFKKCYPECVCKNIRGNVTTRLKKLRSGEYDGVILAAAGLERLGLLEEGDLEYRFFTKEEMLPAGGQGIIAVEGRADDRITEMIREISDEKTYQELLLERRLLEIVDAGCHEAVGVMAEWMDGFVSSGGDSMNPSVRIRLLMDRESMETKLDETVEAEKAMEFVEEWGGRLTIGKSISGGSRSW